MSDDMTTVTRVLRERYAAPPPCPVCGGEMVAEFGKPPRCRIAEAGDEWEHIGRVCRLAPRLVFHDPAVLALIDAYEVAADKAMRFDLDQAGIEQRERDAAELVDLRAKVAEASRKLAVMAEAFAKVAWQPCEAVTRLIAAELDACGFCGGTRVKHAPGCCLGPFVPHNEGGE